MAPKSNRPFDRQRVADFLTQWYEVQMSTALRQPRSAAELQKRGGTVFDIQPEMASSKAVRVLLELTGILGFEPSKDVIKKGGYGSKREFVKELTNRIEQVCKEDQPLKSSAIAKPQKKEASGHAQI